MDTSYHRHDISDEVWSLLEPHLPGQRGQWGGIAQDNRRFINAVFWILRTGAPWCNLPPDYGKWDSVNLQLRNIETGRKPRFSFFCLLRAAEFMHVLL